MIPQKIVYKYNSSQSSYNLMYQEFNNNLDSLCIYLGNYSAFDLQIGLYEFLFNPRFKFFKTIFGVDGVWECCGNSVENKCDCDDDKFISDPVPCYEYHIKRCVADASALSYLEGVE